MAKLGDFYSDQQKRFLQIKMPFSSIICPILVLLAFSFAIAFDFDFDQSAQNRMKNFESRAHLRLKAEAKVAEINRSQRKWTAKIYTRFAEMTEDEFQMMLGLRDNVTGHFLEKNVRNAKAIDLESWRLANNNGNNHRVLVPRHFDARQAWPECSNVIGYIQDQSTCGSCWAFASASVIQDRICIGSKGKTKVPISAQDILTCTSEMLGCSGGIPGWAFHYWADQGVCTGSIFMPSSPYPAYGCKPYAYPPSKDSIYKATPRCERECENLAYPKRYNEDRHFGKKDKVVNLVNATEYDIKKAIFEGGPVVAQMTVYSDLHFYRYGVYEIGTTAKPVGGHAIRIIGWGETYNDNTPYWLIANSWGAEWGLNGTFKIIRGRDECEIESKGITFGTPDL